MTGQPVHTESTDPSSPAGQVHHRTGHSPLSWDGRQTSTSRLAPRPGDCVLRRSRPEKLLIADRGGRRLRNERLDPSRPHEDIPGGAPQIWLMAADGSNARQVTRYGGAHPTRTPDGRRIIFGAPGGSCGSTDVGVLWSVDIETGDQVQVTTAWPQRPDECSAALPGGSSRRSVARTARASSAWSVPANTPREGSPGKP